MSATAEAPDRKAAHTAHCGDCDQNDEPGRNADDALIADEGPKIPGGAHPAEGTKRERGGTGEGGADDTAHDGRERRGAMFALFPALTTAELKDAAKKTGNSADNTRADKTGLQMDGRRAGLAELSQTQQELVETLPDEAKAGQRIEDLVRRIDPPQDREAPRILFANSLQANLGIASAGRPASDVASDGGHRLNSGANADTLTRFLPASPDGIDPEASSERGQHRGTLESRGEGREKQAEPTHREARTFDGGPSAGGDKPSLPLGPAAPPSRAGPIVQTIASAPTWAASIQRIAAITPGMPNAATPIEALKIQLHPAELGMVTANLRIADGQLSIEIDVDTQDAYLKLSGERDAISKALRTGGMAIDNVTVNPPPAHQPAAARDTNAALTGGQTFARQDFQGNGASGQPANNGNAGRQASANSRNDNEHIAPTETRTGSGTAGGGVYI